MGIIEFFKKSNKNITIQRNLAGNLYKDNPSFAMHIAMGEEKAPDGVSSEAVYEKVCNEAEKSDDIET